LEQLFIHEGFLISIGRNMFLFLLMALTSLIFLHRSQLITAKCFKHWSSSSNVALCQVFTVTLCTVIGFCSCSMSCICSWTVLLRQ